MVFQSLNENGEIFAVGEALSILLKVVLFIQMSVASFGFMLNPISFKAEISLVFKMRYIMFLYLIGVMKYLAKAP